MKGRKIPMGAGESTRVTIKSDPCAASGYKLLQIRLCLCHTLVRFTTRSRSGRLHTLIEAG